MSFQEPHAYQHAAAETAQEDIAAAPNKVLDMMFAVLCCLASQTLQSSNAFDGRLTTKLRSKGILMLCTRCLRPKLCSQLPSLLVSATMQRRVS